MAYSLLLRPLGLLLLVLTFQACSPATENQPENPPAEGFNEAGSDAQAIQVADEVMAAQGGRKNWDDTRYLTWNFFGNRRHVWDKQTGDVRVDYLKEDRKVLLNLNTGQGKVYKDGAEVTHPDSLAKYLQQGKEAWINDSYWLVMPYKLKDSGVTLKYLREDTTEAGQPADVLQLTFQDVGVTPQNRYEVYVDKQNRLVSQWAFYPNASDQEPRFVRPWDDYQTYGNIKLSGGRGNTNITEIKVLEQVPEGTFTSLEPVDLGSPQ